MVPNRTPWKVEGLLAQQPDHVDVRLYAYTERFCSNECK